MRGKPTTFTIPDPERGVPSDDDYAAMCAELAAQQSARDARRAEHRNGGRK
jgi:hypothetical protein